MNFGFFKKEEHRNAVTKTTKAPGCAECGLYRDCRRPKFPVGGQGKKGILVIGNAPSAVDDEDGTPFSGSEGKILRAKLKARGIDLDRDCWSTFSVQCRLPKGRKPYDAPAPNAKEIQACRPRVWKEIRELKPQLILLLGGSAVSSFVGDRWKKDKLGDIDRWRGWTIPDREAKGAWVAPLYPLVDVKRAREPKARTLCVELVFDQDLDRALTRLNQPIPAGVFQEAELITIVQDEGELTDRLSWLTRYYEEHPKDLFSVDIETTGLKPYRPLHRIVTCAISWGPNDCIAFPWPTEKPAQRRLKRLLWNPGIRKVAADLSFEDRWFTHFGYPVRGWFWDTQLASHVEDNRPGITGLKFQAYVQHGLLGYDDDARPYLECTDEEEEEHGTNGYNRIEELWRKDPRKLLLYDGIDALEEHRLALEQTARIGMPL